MAWKFAAKSALSLSVSSAALLGAMPAVAQDAQEGAIDQIMVTATRRSASVQSVPYNITAVSGSAIEDAGITSGQELLNLLPGVFASDQGGRTGVSNNISMRGLNANNPAENNAFQTITEPPVSTYINDTPLFLNMTLKDIERVEVLRGPQGTLYGSGSVGGTIRYILNKPNYEETTGEVSASIGTPDHSGDIDYSFDGVLNFPISESAAIRIVAGYEEKAGVIDATGLIDLASDGSAVLADPTNADSGPAFASTVKDVDDQETYYARAMLGAQLGENVDILLTYMHQNTEYGADSVRGVTDPLSGDGPAWENSLAVLTPGEFETDLASIEVTADLGFASFTSASAYSKSEGEFVNDVTGLYTVINAFYFGFPRTVSPSFITQESEVFTQEVRLVSNSEDSNWDWVVGAFYKDEKKETSFQDTLFGYDAWLNDPASYVSYIASFYGLNTGAELLTYFGIPRTDASLNEVPYFQDRDIDFEDFSIFGELTFRPTEQWQITGGIRAFWQDFAQDNFLQFPLCGIFCTSFDPAAEPELAYLGTSIVSNVEDFSDQIFKVNTSYDVSENTMIYATWSEGFRHGGANGFPTVGPFAFDPDLIPFSQDSVDNYEVGVKGASEDNRITYTVAAFLMDWNNVQLDTFLGPLSVPSALNGEGARSKGFEIELNARPSEALTLNFGYSFVDANLSDDVDLGGDQALKGDPLPGVSKHTFSAAMDYTTPLGDLAYIHFHTDLAYRSGFETSYNSDFGNYADVSGFAVWNASVAWEKDKYAITVFVRNITDEEGVSAVQNNRHAALPTDSRAFVRRPRTIGVAASYKF